MADKYIIVLTAEFNDALLCMQIVYYDGQFNDARLAVAVACTSAALGAATLNHAEVVGLIRDPSTGRVVGAHVRDLLTGENFDVHAKVVINATGPFADSIRYDLECDDNAFEGECLLCKIQAACFFVPRQPEFTAQNADNRRFKRSIFRCHLQTYVATTCSQDGHAFGRCTHHVA